MSSRHGSAKALGLIVVLGLAGCTVGGDQPSADGEVSSGPGGGTTTSATSPSITTPPSTTASTTAAQIPAAAQAHTEAGAEAFVKFYMEQVNRALTEPNSTLLPPLSDPGCLSCKVKQLTVTSLGARERRYSGTPATVTRVEAIGGAPKGQQYVRLYMTQHQVNVVDSGGAVVSTDPMTALVRTAIVVWEGSSWRMGEIGM